MSTDQLEPPEVYPEEKGVRWHWMRSAVKYATDAMALTRKLRGEVDRLQRDLARHIGAAVEDVSSYDGKFEEMRATLTKLEEDVEQLITWRERVFGGWTVAKAIITSSLLSTTLGVVLAWLLRR